MGSKKLSSVEQLKSMLETKTDTNANMRVTVIEKGRDFFILADKENEDKVFTLFTRTAREKEEWFNHLLVAAKFMEDYERQNPKEGSPVDPDYETQKVFLTIMI